MGVRVRVRIKALIGPSALANTGYEAEGPEVLLPRPLAEHLGLPARAPEARRAYYETPLGILSLSRHHQALSQPEFW